MILNYILLHNPYPIWIKLVVHSGMVSYDDERSICEKTAYAIDNDLHGYVSQTLDCFYVHLKPKHSSFYHHYHTRTTCAFFASIADYMGVKRRRHERP